MPPGSQPGVQKPLHHKHHTVFSTPTRTRTRNAQLEAGHDHPFHHRGEPTRAEGKGFEPSTSRAIQECGFPAFASAATAPTSPPHSPIPLEASARRMSPSPDLPEIRPQDATLARPPKPVMQACRKDTLLLTRPSRPKFGEKESNLHHLVQSVVSASVHESFPAAGKNTSVPTSILDGDDRCDDARKRPRPTAWRRPGGGLSGGGRFAGAAGESRMSCGWRPLRPRPRTAPRP
jgi:hypothetical protein